MQLSLMIAILSIGLPDSVLDWTRDVDSGLSTENNSYSVLSRKHWRLIRCQNGEIFLSFLVSLKYHENYYLVHFNFFQHKFQDFAYLRS